MLSHIRQISDGNYNNVFVKNKEQKFNLDKEIQDIECWKQSRNHIYRKEERELLAHLEKLHHQQEYLHHLDEERTQHHHTPATNNGQHHHTPTTNNGQHHHTPATNNGKHHHTPATNNGQHHHTPTTSNGHQKKGVRRISHPDLSHYMKQESHVVPVRSPSLSLPPVTDHRELHRTEAHTNICVICQLPRRRPSLRHGKHSSHDVCSCERETSKEDLRRLDHTWKEPPPIQIGQRRHSLMMARLHEQEHKPHPPERSRGGHHQPNHQHQHHEDGQHHGHEGSNQHRHQSGHHAGHHHRHDTHHDHHQVRHRHGNDIGHHSGELHHTPTNSPNRNSRQSLPHHHYHHGGGNIGSHDHHHHTPHHAAHHSRNHEQPPNTGGDHLNGESRRRDHELHWDKHQVHKLRGMITDPQYKEQLELEKNRVYPWSSQYPNEKSSAEDFEEMKNCRYLRFSKLNLESMNENPEREVEVFEKTTSAD